MNSPRQLFFVTNRTFQSRLLMTPSPYVNNLIGGVLARALQRYDVDLFAFVFLSNHYHLVLSSPSGCISEFVSYLQANIAKEIGRHIGWRGSFWQRRFSAEPVLDDLALERRLAYIFAHGIKEGLVDRAAEWPGLHCIAELCHGIRRLFPWFDRTAQNGARMRGQKADEALFVTRNPIVLAPLPAWQSLREQDRRRRARVLLEDAEIQAAEARENKPSLGPQAIIAQDPHTQPAMTKRSPRPLCHASTTAAWRAFRILYRAFVAAYREASALFRAGDASATFPEHSYRPRLPRAWGVMSVARAT